MRVPIFPGKGVFFRLFVLGKFSQEKPGKGVFFVCLSWENFRKKNREMGVSSSSEIWGILQKLLEKSRKSGRDLCVHCFQSPKKLMVQKGW